MPNAILKVAILDPSEVIREGLAHLLAADTRVSVVATIADPETTVTTCRRLAPEVLLVSWPLPVAEERKFFAELAAQAPATRCLAIGSGANALGEDAIAAGTWGYVDRDAGAAEIIKAMRVVRSGEIWATREVLARIIKGTPAKRRGRPRQALISDRESEILLLVAAGLSNEAIARELYVETSTVKTHLLRIFRKLGVRDRAAAVCVGMTRGLIQPPHARA